MTECQNFPPADVAAITHFNNTEGLYYKFLGKLKVTDSDWKLVNFLNLEDYTTRYLALSRFYNTTSQLCSEIRQKIENPENTQSCRQFAQATVPYLHEIDQNHHNILSTIGNNDQSKSRIRRGLGNAVSRVANVLFGNAENIDFGFIFNKITQLVKSKVKDINLTSEQTRIIKLTTNEHNNTLNQILTNQQKLEQNIQLLSEQAKKIAKDIDQIKIRTTLLEQTLFFEVLLNQYAYETQNLLAIIDSALHGKLHTSVLHTQRWLAELREIKANIPIGTTFPLEIKTESIADFIKISELAVCHQGPYLIFVTKIPLVTTIDFNAYKIIPLPIIYDNQSFILIDPSMEIIATSYDTQKFITLTNKQWEMCREVQSYTLCKNSQPIHHKSKSNICEISLMAKPQNFPDTCNIKFVTTIASVWNRLPQSNSWLFYTQSEIITIYCENPARTFTFEIYGVGRLTIITACNIHTDKTLLLPSNHIRANTYADLVPKNSKFNVKHFFSKLLNSLIPQSIINVQIIKDLTEFTHSLQELNTLEKLPSEPPSCIMIDVHIVILYIFISCLIILNTFIIFKVKKNNTKMYKPDLAEIELAENN